MKYTAHNPRRCWKDNTKEIKYKCVALFYVSVEFGHSDLRK